MYIWLQKSRIKFTKHKNNIKPNQQLLKQSKKKEKEKEKSYSSQTAITALPR